jgi:hypothetical protein
MRAGKGREAMSLHPSVSPRPGWIFRGVCSTSALGPRGGKCVAMPRGCFRVPVRPFVRCIQERHTNTLYIAHMVLQTRRPLAAKPP